MATTIKSTALDFQSIKNNLKDYLEQAQEFKDYNFEASGLSNLLDVLAYNTHVNALTANFALNEAFLGTAQLRSSLVSLSEGIGYIPDSKNASSALIKMSLNLSGISDREPRISIPSGYTFTTTVDSQDYTFQTISSVTATDDGSGFYEFLNTDGTNLIMIKEGIPKVKTFISGNNDENITYIIPDDNLDLSTAVVKVHPSTTSLDFTAYNNILDATNINTQSTIYILKEMPNGHFELTFGNGTTLGKTPLPGNKIVVEYLSVAGTAANFAEVFEPVNGVRVTETTTRVPVITTSSKSSGGSSKESLESIRRNAPFQYASQNRMVTHADYSSLVLRNFSSLIKDIKSWGGEDNIVKDYGSVYLSVLFGDNVPTETVNVTKVAINDLAEQLSVASFELKFSDPVKTFIELDTRFQFNDRLTSLTLNTIKSDVEETIRSYFIENTGKFDLSFRRSNILAEIDDISAAILSSSSTVKMQQRITPTLGLVANYNLKFPSEIRSQDDEDVIISSTNFVFRNVNCQIRNKLSSNTLQVINLTDNNVIVDNVGSFSSTGGTINIVGLQVDSITGGQTQIKLSAIPSNQAFVTPKRNDILEFDESRSKATGILTTATN